MKNIIIMLALLIGVGVFAQSVQIAGKAQFTGLTPYGAPVARTGQTNTYLSGDDGSIQIGVAQPNPRFTIQANTNCVLDNATGLMWARNANLPGVAMPWTNAVQYCATNLNLVSYGGYTDWRLPNVRELTSLIAWQYFSPPLYNTAGTAQWSANDPFGGVQSANYWSSTTVMNSQANAWRVYLLTGYMVIYVLKTDSTSYVWPVRGP